MTTNRGLSAVGDSGEPVDWWFIYKVPKDARASVSDKKGKKATGYEYAYFDDQSDVLAGSEHLLKDTENALYRTLQQFSGDKYKTLPCVFYNDEYPISLSKSNNGQRGHCKGVIAFDTDTDSAIWLLHSTPRFSASDSFVFPPEELDYGQTFLCITLKDVATAESIAKQMLVQHGPQTYSAYLLESTNPDSVWHDLAGGRYTLSADPSDVEFQSRGGQTFRSIAKSRKWGQDLWTDLVGPKLGVDLDVESWRRGAIPDSRDSDPNLDVEDVTAIDFNPLGFPYAWPETKDHAKWATSIKGDKGHHNWVCVADINRQVSQAKRGGGAICFQHAKLWQSLSKIDQVTPARLK